MAKNPDSENQAGKQKAAKDQGNFVKNSLPEKRAGANEEKTPGPSLAKEEPSGSKGEPRLPVEEGRVIPRSVISALGALGTSVIDNSGVSNSSAEESLKNEELVRLARDWANILGRKDNPELVEELEELKAQISELVVLPDSSSDQDHFTVLSHAIYQALREALAQNNFQQTEGSPWPTAVLSKGGASGHAQLRPPSIEHTPLLPPEKTEALVHSMWEQQKDLSDLDADALDLLSHIWLQQATSPDSRAVAHVDTFLALRGIAVKWGRKKGFDTKKRERMLQVLSHIQNVWLNLGEVEVYEDDPTGQGKGRRKMVKRALQSRAFIITDRYGQYKLDGNLDMEVFVFLPGQLFAQFLYGPGRQTAMLSAKAVQYDPYRQKWEKRLARYLSWQWRIQAKHGDYTRPFRVATLLETVGEEFDPRRAVAIRDRLEKALDLLQEDSVIFSWQYDRWNEELTEQRGWGQYWLQATILVEPPEIIRDSYKKLERNHEKLLVEGKPSKRGHYPLQEQAKTPEDDLAYRIKQRRKTLRLSQAQAAEQLGIVQSSLSRLERGEIGPTPDLFQRIQTWLG